MAFDILNGDVLSSDLFSEVVHLLSPAHFFLLENIPLVYEIIIF